MKALILSLAVLFLAASPGLSAANTNRLNVLFIISDDLRTELGCYGSQLAKTPNIDRLASSGVRFDRAYCQFPLCNPSRVSMLTSRHPMRSGVIGNRTDFRVAHPEFVTLPQLFKQNGYVSLRAGKIFHGGIDDLESWSDTPGARSGGTNQVSDPDEPDPRALVNRPEDGDGRARAARSDRWVVLEGNGEAHGDFRTADRVMEFLRQNKDKPFFIGCGFVKPHSPPTAPQKFYDLYDLEKIQLPVDFAPRPTVPEGFPRAAIRPRNSDLFMGRDASPDEAKKMIRAYAASTSWMDWNVGRVLAELDRLGLRDETIVVFWGDHGYQLGEKGKWSKAGSLFEQGTRTPLIVAAPNAKGNGKVSERIVENVDIYPTLAELCGLEIPKTVEGRSLAKLIENPDAAWNQPAFSIWVEDGKSLHGVAVRTEKYRYAEFQGGGGGAMLFDVAADPEELKNLADDPKYADARAELSQLIKDYIARNQP